MGILFHKDYDYEKFNTNFNNFNLLLDKQQPREIKLFHSDKPVKSKTPHLGRKLSRCFPRGKAYLHMSNRECLIRFTEER